MTNDTKALLDYFRNVLIPKPHQGYLPPSIAKTRAELVDVDLVEAIIGSIDGGSVNPVIISSLTTILKRLPANMSLGTTLAVLAAVPKDLDSYTLSILMRSLEGVFLKHLMNYIEIFERSSVNRHHFGSPTGPRPDTVGFRNYQQSNFFPEHPYGYSKYRHPLTRGLKVDRPTADIGLNPESEFCERLSEHLESISPHRRSTDTHETKAFHDSEKAPKAKFSHSHLNAVELEPFLNLFLALTDESISDFFKEKLSNEHPCKDQSDSTESSVGKTSNKDNEDDPIHFTSSCGKYKLTIDRDDTRISKVE